MSKTQDNPTIRFALDALSAGDLPADVAAVAIAKACNGSRDPLAPFAARILELNLEGAIQDAMKRNAPKYRLLPEKPGYPPVMRVGKNYLTQQTCEDIARDIEQIRGVFVAGPPKKA